MVLLYTTPVIESAARLALGHLESKSNKKYKTVKQELRQWLDGQPALTTNGESAQAAETGDTIQDSAKPIPHTLVRDLSRVLLACEKDSEIKYSFKELTAGSKMVLESPRPRVKSPELLQLLEKAKLKAENEEYARMTQELIPQHKMTQLTKQERNEYNATIGMFSGILNVLLSMVAVFMAVFWVGHTVTQDIGMKTLLSLLCALIVGFAEGWFFSKDWLFEDREVTKKNV
ncbi:UNVERIFIED_CONTAM: hypothetical protein HDU68_006138 [Siphonaria sp. JEL0065]|nr:hypothetical protein HDU68_006138 [Siphonaria sp. JEL0065]